MTIKNGLSYSQYTYIKYIKGQLTTVRVLSHRRFDTRFLSHGRDTCSMMSFRASRFLVLCDFAIKVAFAHSENEVTSNVVAVSSVLPFVVPTISSVSSSRARQEVTLRVPQASHDLNQAESVTKKLTVTAYCIAYC